jgi:hypothetical protein
MSANNYQFIQTLEMFRDYLSGYPQNLSFEDWKNADAEDQAALLYVTFFKEISLAWYNAITSRNIVYVSQEDGVSVVLQYLMKNVDKILESPQKYCGDYIYRVSYNCIGCLPRSVTAKEKSLIEISNEYVEGDVEVNLWDLVPSEDDDYETQQTKEAVWNIIKHMGPKAEKVVNHLINPSDTIHKVSQNSVERVNDRLADIAVTPAEYETIITELKVKLAPYKDILLSF